LTRHGIMNRHANYWFAPKKGARLRER
jgi:hypothetical protein